MAIQRSVPPTRAEGADPDQAEDEGGCAGESPPPETVLELLDDDCNRTILEATRTDAKSAPELSETCEASRVTVYRRLDDLEDAGLVETAMEYDPDGHHRTVYRARLDAVTVEVGTGDLSVSVTVST